MANSAKEFNPTRNGMDPAAVRTEVAPTVAVNEEPINTTRRSPDNLPRILYAGEKPNVSSGPIIRAVALGGLGLSKEALLTKKALEAEEKIGFILNFDPGEGPGAYRSVTINGYRCEVRKGVLAKLPVSIVAQLAQSANIEFDAQNNNEKNLNNQSEAARSALGVAI